MANQFYTTDFLEEAARAAAMIFRSTLVAPNLVARNVEERFVNAKTGGAVRVRVPATLSATLDESTAGKTSLSVSDNEEDFVSVDATNYAYVKQQLTTKEETFELKDFNRDVTLPAVRAIQEKVDQFFIRRIAGGFARNLVGTAGTAPSTLAHIAAGVKDMNDNLVPMANRVSLIGTTAHADFIQLEKFINADYGPERPAALRSASLGGLYGLEFFMDQNAGTHNRGDIAGTVLTNGVITAGDTSIGMDAFTAATGTVREGTRFTVAGDTQVYTVTSDAAIAGNAATVEISPAASADLAAAGAGSDGDDAAVTFETAYTQDVMYHRDMVAGAIVAPQPLRGIPSAIGTFDNVSIRLTVDSTTSGSDGAVDAILYDVYIGARVVRPAGGVIFQG